MKEKIKLIFAIHNHQPVGNFDHVFRECFEKGYKPFVELLKKNPNIKATIHFTGSLMEWIEEHQSTYFETLNILLEKKQLEMLGGGFYEPILAILPMEDAIGQIKLQSAYLKKHFSITPNGVWLAERVWDGSMPEILARANVNYTIIDDTHFKYAGFNQEDIHGYYVSERLGHKINVFPIDKNLRYMIPFAEPQKVIDYLSLCAEKFPGSSVCYADDGEKFGVWPDTYKTCYQEKWLERFFTLVQENSDWIEMKHPSEVLKENKSKGLVYLPNASYEEMLEWALPLNAAFRYKIMQKNLESLNLYGPYKDFIRGGIWPNFLVKYPESNLMYRKMLYVSKKVNDANVSEDIKARALDELYKGQCNCPYWHGLFGGLYLNYLRHAIYYHLINADRIIAQADKKSKKAKVDIKLLDYTSNGYKEIITETPDMFTLWCPEWGGSLVELDSRQKGFNVSNIMSRRKEVYHIDMVKDNNKETDQANKDQALKTDKKPLPHYAVFYDKYNRFSFLDHFLPQDTSVKNLMESSSQELGTFITSPYSLVETGENCFTLESNGFFRESQPVMIQKQFIFDKNQAIIDAFYQIKNNSDKPIEAMFGTEFNFTFLAGRDDGRFYEINDEPLQGEKKYLCSSDTLEDVGSVTMIDLWSGLHLKLAFKDKAKLLRYPIETISHNEAGIEKTYQGSSLLPLWPVNIPPNSRIEFSIRLSLTEQL